EQMVAHVAHEVLGTTQLAWADSTIDVAPPWPRRTMRDLLIEHSGIDYAEHGELDSLRRAAENAGIAADPSWSRAKIIDELMTVFVEPTLVQPTFVINYPAETTPLAKRRPAAPDEVVQFIREYTDLVRQAMANRHADTPLDRILELDGRRRETLRELEGLRSERNQRSARIGAATADERQQLIEETRAMSARIAELEPVAREIDA